MEGVGKIKERNFFEITSIPLIKAKYFSIRFSSENFCLNLNIDTFTAPENPSTMRTFHNDTANDTIQIYSLSMCVSKDMFSQLYIELYP